MGNDTVKKGREWKPQNSSEEKKLVMKEPTHFRHRLSSMDSGDLLKCGEDV